MTCGSAKRAANQNTGDYVRSATTEDRRDPVSQPDIETSVDGKIPEEKFPRTLPLRHLVHEAQDFDCVLTPSFVGFYSCLLSLTPDYSEENE